MLRERNIFQNLRRFGKMRIFESLPFFTGVQEENGAHADRVYEAEQGQ